jgi:2-oxoglutarate ferredoxin oxidoreductase subunit alpha
MTPVVFLSDGYLTNGSEPWRIPEIDTLPKIQISHDADPQGYRPYDRDPVTLARKWVIPGTPGLEHRVGGLETEDGTGNVCYDPINHEIMVRMRQAKIKRIADDIPLLKIRGKPEADVLVLGWGSTYGAITTAVDHLQTEGKSVSSAHLRHLNPFPKNLGEVLKSFKTILVPELNLGQLRLMLRGSFNHDFIGLNKVQGQPFKVREIEDKINELLR